MFFVAIVALDTGEKRTANLSLTRIAHVAEQYRQRAILGQLVRFVIRSSLNLAVCAVQQDYFAAVDKPIKRGIMYVT
jgi:hypothetical protein